MQKHSLNTNGSKLEKRFEIFWKACNGPRLLREYRFHPTRKWRFDFSHLESKIAIEIEGGTWVFGRHNTGAGFQRDSEKYNEAIFLGWKVFRLTEGMIRVQTLERIRDFIGETTALSPTPQ